MQNKKLKSTSRKILTVNPDTINDCVSSWLTATGMIARDEFVIGIELESGLARGDIPQYEVEICSGKEKEIKENEEEKHVEKA